MQKTYKITPLKDPDDSYALYADDELVVKGTYFQVSALRDSLVHELRQGLESAGVPTTLQNWLEGPDPWSDKNVEYVTVTWAGAAVLAGKK